MKETAKKILILLGLIVIFVLGNFSQTKKRLALRGVYQGKTEFVKTIDCAPIFDKNPTAMYRISFDIKAEIPGNMRVYQDDKIRYYFEKNIYVTEEVQHFDIVVKPELKNISIENSYLCFHGQYGTGVIPTVSNILVEEIP